MADPQTPPLSASSHRGFYDSPFSDYHTDSSRSSNSTSSSTQKDLMRRLNYIGAMIQRGEPPTQLVRAMNSKLDAVEAILAAPEPQSRLHLEDSGLFMDDEELKTKDDAVKETVEELLDVPEEDFENRNQMTFDLERIAQNVEEHMDYMNQLLDEAKSREEELEGYLEQMRASKDNICERLEEVKRNNTAALEHIGLQDREIASLKKINKVMEQHIDQVEEMNSRLHTQLDTLQPTPPLIQDPDDTRWKASLPSTDAHNDEQLISTSTPKSSSPILTTSRWTTFWNALNDIAGVIDYDDLMRGID